jgi:hypothetical protein
MITFDTSAHSYFFLLSRKSEETILRILTIYEIKTLERYHLHFFCGSAAVMCGKASPPPNINSVFSTVSHRLTAQHGGQAAKKHSMKKA